MTRWRRTAGAALAAAGAAIGLALLVVRPVAAECDGPIPPFRDHADTARRILIGEVTWTEPGTRDAFARSSHFTLRVTDVLRGPAVRTLEVRDLAFLDCADHVIAAAKGERIALAIDAHGFTPPITFATIAWIRAATKIERAYGITEAEVFALVGRAPDTATPSPDTAPQQPAAPAWPLLALAAFGGLLAWRPRRRACSASRTVGPVLLMLALAGCAAEPAARWTPPAVSPPASATEAPSTAATATAPARSPSPTPSPLSPEPEGTPPPLNEAERWVEAALARMGLQAFRAEGSPHDRASMWVDLGSDRVLSVVTVPAQGAPPDWETVVVRSLAGVELRTVRNDGGLESEWIVCGPQLVTVFGDVPDRDATLDAFIERLVRALDCR